MNLHANARTCPNSRELLARRVIEEDWSYARAAQAAGVSKRTVAKWVARRRRGESMADRSSAPRRVPSCGLICHSSSETPDTSNSRGRSTTTNLSA
jgi:transposase-like protein